MAREYIVLLHCGLAVKWIYVRFLGMYLVILRAVTIARNAECCEFVCSGTFLSYIFFFVHDYLLRGYFFGKVYVRSSTTLFEHLLNFS